MRQNTKKKKIKQTYPSVNNQSGNRHQPATQKQTNEQPWAQQSHFNIVHNEIWISNYNLLKFKFQSDNYRI